MKSIKTLVYVSCIGLTTGLVSSCNKDEIEVIEQNTSWTIDQKYIDSDIREKIGDIPSGDLLYFHKKDLSIEGINENDVTTLLGEQTFQLKICVTKANERDIPFQLVVNSENLSEQTQLFPEGSYTLKEGIISAGETEGFVEIGIKDANLLKEGTYELPILLKLADNDQVSAAKERGVFKLKANVIASLGNLNPENPTIEGEVFNQNINLNSNENRYYLNYLTDGSTEPGSGWWRKVWESSSPKTYLQASFQEETTIKGIIINSEEGNNQLQGARVWVGQNGKLHLHGEFQATTKNKKQYIIFKEAVTTKAIVFNHLKSKNGYRVSLTEIEFIK